VIAAAVLPDFFVVFRICVALIGVALTVCWLYDAVRAYRRLPPAIKRKLWSLKPSRFAPELVAIGLLMCVWIALVYFQWRLY